MTETGESRLGFGEQPLKHSGLGRVVVEGEESPIALHLICETQDIVDVTQERIPLLAIPTKFLG